MRGQKISFVMVDYEQLDIVFLVFFLADTHIFIHSFVLGVFCNGAEVMENPNVIIVYFSLYESDEI